METNNENQTANVIETTNYNVIIKIYKKDGNSLRDL